MKKLIFTILLGIMLSWSLNVFANPTPVPKKAKPVPVASDAKEQVQSQSNGQTSGEDPLDRLESEMKSKETTDIAYGVMSPGLKIGGIILIVLGIVLVVGAIGYLAIAFIKALVGKGRVTKSHIGLACGALVLGILLICGSWFKLLKFGKSVGIDPVNDKIIEQQVPQKSGE